MAKSPEIASEPGRTKLHPFRRAVLRGLAIVMPPLLTMLVFLWMWNMIDSYVLRPLEGLTEDIVVWAIQDTKKEIPATAERMASTEGDVTSFDFDGTTYVPFRDRWIPGHVKQTVDSFDGEHTYELTTVKSYYKEFARIRFLQRSMTIPVFLAVFILVLYLIGKLMAAGVGNMTWRFFEQLIHQLPIIRTVYSAAKQVTDFVFTEQEVQFNRVVAVEYPRQGVWSMGFVTGESFLAIRDKAQEPVLSVLMPTSPMPATGFTITVPRSQTIELDITVDQAIQFCVSCGVVVPRHQQYPREEAAQAIPSSLNGGTVPVLPAASSGKEAGGSADQPQQA